MDRRSFVSSLVFTAAGLLAGCTSSSEQGGRGSAAPDADALQEVEVDKPPAGNVGERPFSAVSYLESLSTSQKNSLNMMNYLTVLAQRVIAAKNNRLILDEVYRELYNNITPDAVDGETLDQISYLAGTIEEFRMTDVKRERLRRAFECAQVDAARQAIPDPIALLSAATSGGLARFAMSVVYMAVDSASSYSAALDGAEAELVKGNWELDDEQSKTLHESRDDLFAYIVNMVAEYDVPGFMSMTEETAEQFASWEKRAVAQRIRYFEKNCDRYCALGAYWLVLACSYYEDADYERCIRAIETYETFSTGIFRNDYGYAKALTLGISAAEISDEHDYVEYVRRWAPVILENCDDADWASRYFVAQCYLSIAGKTGDSSYISLAYETALDNVNELIPVQLGMNGAYAAPVKKKEGAENFPWSQEDKKDKHRYNKLLEQERKVELPPIHQPLLMNLELIHAILGAYPDYVDSSISSELLGESPFLTEPLNERYVVGVDFDLDAVEIEYDCDEVKIPASILAMGSKVVATVKQDSGASVIEDWAIDRVERGEDDDPSTHIAFFKSKSAKKFDYAEGATVKLEIDVLPEIGVEPLMIGYKAISTKEKPWDHIAVWDDGFWFERQ